MIDEMIRSYILGDLNNHKWLTAIDTTLNIPIGLAYFAPEKMTNGTWNILLIAVRSSYQGKGVGKKLVESIENILKNKKVCLLLIETSGLPEFEKSRQFYLNGFVKEATIRDYYQNGGDKIIFRKKIRLIFAYSVNESNYVSRWPKRTFTAEAIASKIN